MKNSSSLKHQIKRLDQSENLPSGIVGARSLPVVYLNMPKAACSSIKNHLFFLEHGEYIPDPLAIHSIEGLIKSKDKGAEVANHFSRIVRERHLIFTFVRHPGKRAYSCFSEKIVHIGKYSFPKVREHLSQHFGLALSDLGQSTYTLDTHRRNFVAYLRFVRANLAGETSIPKNGHWNLQTTMLRSFESHFFIDFIGRVERFKDHFNFVLSELGSERVPDLSLRFNEGPTPPYTYEQIVNEEVENLLFDVYGPDFKDLGYGGR